MKYSKLVLSAAMTAGILVGPAAASAMATPSEGLHCPDHNAPGNTKVEATDDTQEAVNTFVPPAGVEFCAKGGTGNTGKQTGDGVKTLITWMFDEGVTNGGGKTPDVSYYVIYKAPDPTCESHPSPDLCAKPDDTTENRPKTLLDCATKTVTTWTEYRDFKYTWDAQKKAWVGAWTDWAEVEDSRSTVPATPGDCLPHVGVSTPVGWMISGAAAAVLIGGSLWYWASRKEDEPFQG